MGTFEAVAEPGEMSAEETAAGEPAAAGRTSDLEEDLPAAMDGSAAAEEGLPITAGDPT